MRRQRRENELKNAEQNLTLQIEKLANENLKLVDEFKLQSKNTQNKLQSDEITDVSMEKSLKISQIHLILIIGCGLLILSLIISFLAFIIRQKMSKKLKPRVKKTLRFADPIFTIVNSHEIIIHEVSGELMIIFIIILLFLFFRPIC